MSLLRELIHGIERMNLDRQQKLHPAIHNSYHLGKAIIGEPLGEMSVLIDDVGSIGGHCDSCPDEGVELRDVALTVEQDGNLRSVRMRLCGHCVDLYNRVVDVVPEAERMRV